jgi:hypothetical protein
MFVPAVLIITACACGCLTDRANLTDSGSLRNVCPCRPAHDYLRLRFPACQSQLDCVWLSLRTSSPAERQMTACACGSLSARAKLIASGFLLNICRCRPAHDCVCLLFPVSQNKLDCVWLPAQTSAPAVLIMTAYDSGFLPSRDILSASFFLRRHLPLTSFSCLPAPALACLPEPTRLCRISCATSDPSACSY